MGEPTTIIAKTIGNPSGEQYDNPWPFGRPAKRERVAIFAFEVTSVDGEAEAIRTYHVGPADLAEEGRIAPRAPSRRGSRCSGPECGGTVVRPPTSLDIEAAMMDLDHSAEAMF
ncbi:hypothetical protein OIE68_09370 [Nocardia vinacea]|uniref:Uncharacterized protein n=1 Tax=Nocardia vinacea TaxID=96468 RepID=A0ABZ1YRU0_9NOCA|nr:hypothetical protein OIE68_09370 [Nocardia vinacea]